MARYKFRLLNVFAEQTFGGNPLCVFEDGRGLTDEQMMLLTRQFNLSETTFILPADTPRVRVFTPGYEMAFAGHPTLGTAQVVREVYGTGDQITLAFKAGLVPVRAQGNVWTLSPPLTQAPTLRAADESPALIAGLLGLSEDDLADAPCWVDTGADQLLIPVKTADAVSRAAIDASRIAQWPLSSLGRQTGYVFAIGEDTGNTLEVNARYFFFTGGAVSEDPGTGSACANLGAWLAHRRDKTAISVRVTQGEKMGRLCRLWLNVDAHKRIEVGGQVIEIGRGEVDI